MLKPTIGYVTDLMGDRAQMEVRHVNCFVLCKEIEEVKGCRYVIRKCRLIYDETSSFPLDVRDEVGAVPRSLDELGITLPLDLADRVWERTVSEWGDLKHVQESFRRYERLFDEYCAQMNSEEMLRAFETSERNAALLKIYPSSTDLERRRSFLDNVGGKFEAWFGMADMSLPEQIQEIVQRLRSAPPAPEQATTLDRFKAECDARGLKKGKTVPREVLFEIAKEIYSEGVSPFEQFKSGDRIYQRARKVASDLGFRKLPRGNTLQENY